MAATTFPIPAGRSSGDVGSVVLIVDDERDILESLAAVLRQDLGNATIRTATSGEAALEILRRERVDLILSDYKIPEMNGLEFLARAKTLAPTAARVMMTAFPDPDLASRAAREVGVGLFIAKPFDLSYLVGVVRTIVQGTRAA